MLLPHLDLANNIFSNRITAANAPLWCSPGSSFHLCNPPDQSLQPLWGLLTRMCSSRPKCLSLRRKERAKTQVWVGRFRQQGNCPHPERSLQPTEVGVTATSLQKQVKSQRKWPLECPWVLRLRTKAHYAAECFAICCTKFSPVKWVW